jgi:hypothetical protein
MDLLKSWKIKNAKVKARWAELTAMASELEHTYQRKKSFACNRQKVIEDVANEMAAQHAKNNPQVAFQAKQKWY